MDIPVTYTYGLTHCSVCSALTGKETESWLNENEPSGTKANWVLSGDKEFASGEPHPRPCEEKAGRMHYLFVC